MAVTIKDIAKYTGFSISTVSIALSGKTDGVHIGDEAIKQIKEAQIALGYRPNMLARGLRKNYTNTIGFVLSDVSNPFFVKIASIIEQEAANLGYHVFFAGSDEDDIKCQLAIETFINYKVDGLIIAATSGTKNVIQQLVRQKIPFVLVDRYFKRLNINSVVMDNYGAAYRAVQYLISKSRKRIATFSYETELLHMHDRFNGYKAALKDNKIPFDKRLVPSIPFMKANEDQVKSHVKELLEKTNVDAFFFQTNRSALPALEFLLLNDYKIPEEISVISFQDNDFFKLVRPAITALKQPVEQLGQECVRILINHIKGNKHVEKILIPEICIEERESV